MWLEPGAYSGRTSTCVYACHHSCKTQTALLAHFFLPFLGSGFGGADDFRFAPRAAAGFDDEDRPSLVRYPCPGGLHCHVRHATWPLETALQLEAGWGPYLSSTEGLEALPGLPRETTG